MTTLSSWSYTQPLTFWSVQIDEFGQPSYALEFEALGTWTIGGETQAADNGVQFVPASTFWIERGPDDARPTRGWKVARGSHDNAPPADAEIIRKTGASDDAMHGFDAVDWVMWT